MKMRIAIREQLGLLVLLCCFVCVAVIAAAVWITNTNFVTSVSTGGLSLAATLYAQQLGTNLLLVKNSAEAISSRVIIQHALGRYIQNSNNTAENWVNAIADLQAGLGTSGAGQYLVQAQVYGPDTSGLGGPYPVLNGTSNATVPIQLPYSHPNGTAVFLGDDDDGGYPPMLYPRLNISSQNVNSTFNLTQGTFLNSPVTDSSPLVVGPYPINSSFALFSITVPMLNNSASAQIIGWLTVTFTSDPIYLVQNSSLGLADTGVNLIVSPATLNNRLPDNVAYNSPDQENSTLLGQQKVRFVVPPTVNSSRSTRHSAAQYPNANYTFNFSQYSEVQSVFASNQHSLSNAGSNLNTYNEEGDHVAVGYARIDTDIADWAILVEETFDEVNQPFISLRNVLLACIFGTVGAIVLFIFPLAHYSVRPIRDLRAATLKTVDPYDFSEGDEASDHDSTRSLTPGSGAEDEENQADLAKKEGLVTRMMTRSFRKPKRRIKTPTPPGERKFRIPGKVKDRKHVVTDELTDLTRTFNDMAEELMMQYARLEERVKERTIELELSKKAAEAANESKTLFIANISHELKTPLNGILGMCAVSMSEDDPTKIKRSLGIIYKSGDLLLNLLTDLLTFSKNQIGQHLTLDEKDFRLADISSQVLSIFDKQAKEGSISMDVLFEGPNYSLETASGTPAQPGYGPFGTGRVRDMWLWGDQHRILQVVINLVSNSLKFTPAGGSITVRIKCVGEAEPEGHTTTRKDSTNSKVSKNTAMSKTSKTSKDSSVRSSRFRGRGPPSGSNSENSIKTMSQIAQDEKKNIHTALEINSREPKTLQSPAPSRDRSVSPPPINARILLFEFEVEDTGPGIPPTQQKKIFEPFVQGDLGLSKKYGGTGLGLSICAQLAGLMRGSMALRSVEGDGSIFTMRIPLRFVKERADSTKSSSYQGSMRSSIPGLQTQDEAPGGVRQRSSDSELSTHSIPQASSPPARAVLESSAGKPRLVGLSQPFFATSPPLETGKAQLEAMERVKAQAASSNTKVRVLVAEDNKVNQEVVLRMLKLEDIYDVTVAKDGQEAYDMVKESMEQKKLFNLVFMDVQMPNLDGLQSTRLIRGMGFSAPIVALTAFAEESNVQECMDSGMDFFLPKPIRRPALKQVLKRYCATIPESEEPESPPPDKKDEQMDGAIAEASEGTNSGSEGTKDSENAATTTQTTPFDDLRGGDVSPLS